MAERKAFPFYFEWLNYLDRLAPDVAYRAVKALCSVAQGNPLKSVNDPAADMLLSILSGTIQRDAEKYEEACITHKAAGKKGGRPKANNFSKNQKEAKKPKGSLENQMVSDETKRFSEKPKKPDTGYWNLNLDTELEPERSSTSPVAPKGADELEKSKNAQAESLTVEMARGTAKAADHSTTPVQKRFDEFWTAYPKKIGKKAAQTAFVKIKPDAVLLGKMLSTLGWQAKSEQWQRNGGQYIPNPATWLNQGRWDDQPDIQQAPEKQPSYDLDAYERDSMMKFTGGKNGTV